MMFRHVCPWWGGYFIDNRLRRLLHKPEKILATHIQSGMTVMDFGCGMGFFAISMANLVGSCGRVVAVDLQERMLNVLRKRAARAGVADQIHAHRCEPESVEADRTTDFVLAFYSLHEVPNLRRLLSELHGCLRPTGKLLIVEPIGHVRAFTFQTMICLAEEIGFRLDDRPRICLSHTALLAKK